MSVPFMDEGSVPANNRKNIKIEKVFNVYTLKYSLTDINILQLTIFFSHITFSHEDDKVQRDVDATGVQYILLFKIEVTIFCNNFLI